MWGFMKTHEPLWKPALNSGVLYDWISWESHVNRQETRLHWLRVGKVCNMTDNFNLTENLSNIIPGITVSTNNPMDKDTVSNIFIQNHSPKITAFLKCAVQPFSTDNTTGQVSGSCLFHKSKKTRSSLKSLMAFKKIPLAAHKEQLIIQH